MKYTSVSLIAYGCVATIPNIAPISERLRRGFYSARDRVAFMFGSLSRLDYRNHDDAATYNLGDHAIMLSCISAIQAVCPGVDATPVNWMELNDSHATRNAIVICGSGYFFLDSQLRLPSRISDDVAFAEKHNLPIIIYGSGVNYPDAAMKNKQLEIDLIQQSVLRRLLKRCIFISVRDDMSRQLLQAYTEHDVKVIGDPALFLKSRDPISATVKNSQRPAVGLNLAFHGSTQNERLISSLPEYITTFKKLQKASGCIFQYMIHYDAELVVAKMLQDAGIELVINRCNVEDLLISYSRLNLHIGGMLHSCILSASTGTPCIGLAYDIKHSGFFDVLELPKLCIPTEPWQNDLVLQKSLEALASEGDLRRHIAQRKAILQENAYTFLKHAISKVTFDASTL